MDRKFGSNMSYSALENVINMVKTSPRFGKEASEALDEVLAVIKLTYTYKGE